MFSWLRRAWKRFADYSNEPTNRIFGGPPIEVPTRERITGFRGRLSRYCVVETFSSMGRCIGCQKLGRWSQTLLCDQCEREDAERSKEWFREMVRENFNPEFASQMLGDEQPYSSPSDELNEQFVELEKAIDEWEPNE